jgi:hypothetical protein
MDVPIALGLAAAFAASAWSTLRGGGPVYYDSVTMFIALLLIARYGELAFAVAGLYRAWLVPDALGVGPFCLFR